jgi:putative copper export protein
MTIRSGRKQARSAPVVVAVVLVAATLAVAVLAMIAALLAAGGAPMPVPAGLSGAGTAVPWAVPVLRLIADLAAIACAGGVLAALVMLPVDGERLGSRGQRACQDAAVAAGIWAVASISGLAATAAAILGVPLSSLSLRADDAAKVPQVRVLAVSVVLVAILAVLLSGCRSVPAAQLALLLIGCALAGPLLTGHSAAEGMGGGSLLASASLVIHVIAVTAWVGGLGALLRYGRGGDARAAVERFSGLALACAVAVGLTGLLTAEIHLGSRDSGWALITQWATSGYGAVVFAKAVAFACLVAIGWWHRSRTLPALVAGRPSAFWRVAAGELVVMTATVGLAVALSRTP